MRGKPHLLKLIITILFLAGFVLVSCNEKKTRETEETPETVKKIEVEEDETTPPKDTTTIENPVVVSTIQDITGSWTGTFDKRSTTLNITEQTDSSFSGKITINYRQVINQEVKGSFSPSTMKMTMKDQLHSRFQGKYKGKLSENGKNLSGTFTMNVDGSKFQFNLNKK